MAKQLNSRLLFPLFLPPSLPPTGYFDLDPNRCFSLLLDAITSQPDNDALLDLVPAFRHVIGDQRVAYVEHRWMVQAVAIWSIAI